MVLVGDHQQLPPTILGAQNKYLGLDMSLFQRLKDAGWPVHALKFQYRMRPQISHFPSLHFYKGELQVSFKCE